MRFEFSKLKGYFVGLFWVSPYHSFFATSNISKWSARFIFWHKSLPTCVKTKSCLWSPSSHSPDYVVGGRTGQAHLCWTQSVTRSLRTLTPRNRSQALALSAGWRRGPETQILIGQWLVLLASDWSKGSNTGFWLVITDEVSPFLFGDSHVSLMLYRSIGGAVRFTHCSSIVQWPAVVCCYACLDANAAHWGFYAFNATEP